MTTLGKRILHPHDIPDFRLALLDGWRDGGGWAKSLTLRSNFNSRPIDFQHSRNLIDWERDTLSDCELWWVSPEMMDLLEAVVDTIPDDHVFDASDIVDHKALVVFPRPVVGHSSDNWEEVQVDAILWGPVHHHDEELVPVRDTGVAIPMEYDAAGMGLSSYGYATENPIAATYYKGIQQIVSETGLADDDPVVQFFGNVDFDANRERVLEFFAVAEQRGWLVVDWLAESPFDASIENDDPTIVDHRGKKREYRDWYCAGVQDPAPPKYRSNALQLATPGWYPLGRSDWMFGQQVPDHHWFQKPESPLVHSQAEDRRIILALWLISQQTAVAELADEKPDRPTRRRSERKGKRADVKIVYLRRPAKPKADQDPDAEHEGVEWSCRWVVRPHFRSQPYGPGRKFRRTILVGPYVKGPEDKPLVVRPTVKALVR